MTARLMLVALSAAFALGATRTAPAQTLYGVDGDFEEVWEFTSAAGGDCNAPILTADEFDYNVGTGPCGLPFPSLFGFPLGDVADDPEQDVVIVTDGLVIAEYTGDPACGTPGVPVNLYEVDPGAGLGPLTGMGHMRFDPFTGLPALWVTDGITVAIVIRPFGFCLGPAIVSFACAVSNPTGALLTDLSWDHTGGLLWTCDADGYVASWDVGNFDSCTLVTGPTLVTTCGITPPLTGIAVDDTTPNPITLAPLAAYVTDGSTVAYINPISGAPAPPTFAAPTTCTPTQTQIAGLAHSQHGITYGEERVVARLGSYAQSISPNSEFGLEVRDAPPATQAFLIMNFSFPGPGYLCPGLPGVGTTIRVNPTAPGFVSALGSLPPGCVPLPLPIPPLVPTGLVVFAQFVFIPFNGPPAEDATQGLAFTIATL